MIAEQEEALTHIPSAPSSSIQVFHEASTNLSRAEEELLQTSDGPLIAEQEEVLTHIPSAPSSPIQVLPEPSTNLSRRNTGSAIQTSVIFDGRQYRYLERLQTAPGDQAVHNESPQTALRETPNPAPESLNSRAGSTTASPAGHDFADGDEDLVQGSQPDMIPTVSHQPPTAPELITNLTGSEAERCRERVIDEVFSWDGCSLNKERIRQRLIFQVDENGVPLNRPPRGEIDEERKKLEYFSITGKISGPQPFQVYGLPDLFNHDLLKCWIYLNQHRLSAFWPTGYTPEYATLAGGWGDVELPENVVRRFEDDEMSVMTASTID